MRHERNNVLSWYAPGVGYLGFDHNAKNGLTFPYMRLFPGNKLVGAYYHMVQTLL